MSILKKIIEVIKNMFSNKKEEVKALEEPKTIIQNDKKEFLSALKFQKKRKHEVETLVCEGDGLGIQKKMSS